MRTILAVAMAAAIAASAYAATPTKEDGKLAGKRIVILVEAKVNELESLYPYYRFQEEGAKVELAGGGEKSYVGENGMTVKPVNLNVADLKVADWDAVICAGGYAPERLRRDKAAVDFVRGMYDAGKIVTAICHGPQMLITVGILRGKHATSFSGVKDDVINAGAIWEDQPVVRDGNIITSRGPRDLPYFCPAIIEALGG